MLRQCCRVSRALCEAATLAQAPEVLLAARDGQHGPLALLALSTMLEGAAGGRHPLGSAPIATPATPAQAALAPSAATDDAIRKLAGVLDMTHAWCRCGCIVCDSGDYE